jgi:hypothetical protein
MTTPLDLIVLVRAQKKDMMTMITVKKEEGKKTNMMKTITAERTATWAAVAVVAVAEVGAVRVAVL